MPNVNLNDLSTRLQSLKVETGILNRKRQEEARKAYTALSNISKDSIEMLKSVVPEIEIVTKFSEEDISNNTNGEVELIRTVYNKLTTYIEERISYYESGLV